MHVQQFQYYRKNGWSEPLPLNADVDLVLVFGDKKLVKADSHNQVICKSFPNAVLASVSTAGEIHDSQAYEHTLSVTAITFEKTSVTGVQVDLNNYTSSFNAGQDLAQSLNQKELSHVLLFSDGIVTNGSDLIQGLESVLLDHITISGGLAGDGASFNETIVGLNGNNHSNQAVIIGFYGPFIQINHAAQSGWIPLGPRKKITLSTKNTVYEFDHKPAIDFYKSYLNEQAKELPSSGLLFPLKVYTSNSTAVIRTVVGVDTHNQSLVFAGNMPEGSSTQIMHATADDLLTGALQAAEALAKHSPDLVIMVSCVARKLLLDDQITDEVHDVYTCLNHSAYSMAGFYSYGQINPGHLNQQNKKSHLHNQTLTLIAIRES
ncbi:histidine kinase [bacterium]|nr:histidine kinase [bacterium]|tara:strand:- start:245 stop:1375 length:1131 start_codon:yes stop_codon:yes gene_type:complete